MKANGSSKGDGWIPPGPIALPPFYAWPPRPMAVIKWLFGMPGFLWPMNSATLAITGITWCFLTPSLENMKSLGAWWVMVILLRNFALVGIFVGGLHVYLLVLGGQGDALKFSTRPLAKNNGRFLFRDQLRDNIVRTLFTAVPILTAFEVATYWLFANIFIPGASIGASPAAFWLLFAGGLLAAPAIHALHFYLTHRVLHWPPLYRSVHRIHHNNVEVGPWSGLAMHPVELALYFSTVCIQWLVAVHPVNALFQLQIAVFNAAVSHTGFERVIVGGRIPLESNNYFHYLHHKLFDCNFGSTLVPMDQLFGTFHDGTPGSFDALRRRKQGRPRPPS